MNPRCLGFASVQFLASLAFVTATAFAGEPGAINVFVSPSQTVRLSIDGATEMARVRVMFNFPPSGAQSITARSPGGVNLALADGSVRFLKSTIPPQPIIDPGGNLVEIQAELVDTRTGHSWSIQILPFIEQDNLYSAFLTDGQVRLEFNVLAYLLPAGRTNRFAADRCSPDAGDVFRPNPPDSFGHIDGDAASADGMWGLRFSPADQRRYFADHEPVLADFTPDGFLSVAFPMTEVGTGSDQIRQVSIVQAIATVFLDDIVSASRPTASAVCMSLSRDGNVFAVWLTVGYFEVVDDTTGTPRLRFFAIVDRTQF